MLLQAAKELSRKNITWKVCISDKTRQHMLTIKRISLFKKATSNLFKKFTSREGIKKFFGVSLYRNAILLILDGAIPAVTGFVFWVVAARLYSTENIGIASAAIAANGLLVGFSLLGLNNALIRFLPTVKDCPADMINSSLTLGGLVAVVAALIFIAGIDIWSPALISIRDNPLFFIIFVIFVPVNLLNSLSEAVFLAQRRSDLILWQDIIGSLLRFIPLILLSILLANYGIFLSWGLAVLVATVIGILFFIPITQNGYKPIPIINKKIIGEMVQFSTSNYIASLLAMSSGSILPLIVLNILGAAQNAYFYISWIIGSTVASVPLAVTTSLFAEGANDEQILWEHVKRTIKFMALLLVPLIIIILFFGRWFLLIFGKRYSQNAVTLLQVLTITALPLSVSAIYFTIKRIQKAMKSVVLMTGFTSVVTLGLSYVLLPRIGILGAGIAWLIANSIVSLLIIIIWLRNKSIL